MKVIDLLNKIANGEIKEIQRFIFEGKCYNQCSNIEKFSMFKTYYYVNGKETEYTTLGNIFDIENLNTLIVIEEDKKIKKLDEYEYDTANEILIIRKINEIIDYLEENK